MASSPKLYVDSCCFIDAVKKEVGLLPTDRDEDVWYLKHLMRAHQEKLVTLYTSIVTLTECVAVVKGQAEVPKEVQDHFRQLLMSGQFVRLVTPTPKTARYVQELRWTHSVVLKGLDALHIATALEVGCSEFQSCDERLKSEKLKAAIPILATKLHLKLIRASQTAHLPDKYLQPTFVK